MLTASSRIWTQLNDFINMAITITFSVAFQVSSGQILAFTEF